MLPDPPGLFSTIHLLAEDRAGALAKNARDGVDVPRREADQDAQACDPECGARQARRTDQACGGGDKHQRPARHARVQILAPVEKSANARRVRQSPAAKAVNRARRTARMHRSARRHCLLDRRDHCDLGCRNEQTAAPRYEVA